MGSAAAGKCASGVAACSIDFGANGKASARAELKIKELLDRCISTICCRIGRVERRLVAAGGDAMAARARGFNEVIKDGLKGC